MLNINAILDENITEENRNELVSVLKDIDPNAVVSIYGTHEMGGVAWFPTDIIINLSLNVAPSYFDLLKKGLTYGIASGIGGVLGKELLRRIIEKINKIFKSNQTKHQVHNAFLRFPYKDKFLYFGFDEDNIDVNEEAVEILIRDINKIVKELNKFLKCNPEKLFGDYLSIVFAYTESDKKWTVQFLSNHD